MATATWNDAAHPRVPAGVPSGGQFTSGGLNFVEDGDWGNMTDDQVRDYTRQHFGREMSRVDVAQAAGAMPGASVEVVPTSELGEYPLRKPFAPGIRTSGGALSVFITFPDPNNPDDPRPAGEAHRTITRDEVYNEHFELQRGFRGKGIGLNVFSTQVENASRLGFKRLATEASGTAGSYNQQNGSYTWARLGFNGYLRNGPGPKGEETTHQLMSTPEGVAWWKSNSSTFSGVFDLAPGSTSMRVFTEYKRLKEAARARG